MTEAHNLARRLADRADEAKALAEACAALRSGAVPLCGLPIPEEAYTAIRRAWERRRGEIGDEMRELTRMLAASLGESLAEEDGAGWEWSSRRPTEPGWFPFGWTERGKRRFRMVEVWSDIVGVLRMQDPRHAPDMEFRVDRVREGQWGPRIRFPGEEAP